MPTFSPPTANDVPRVTEDYRRENPLGWRLFRHYSLLPRGRTVLKSAAGVYTTVDNPSQDDIDAAAVAYLGGHIYQITSAEATALTAAGYGAYITGV